MRSLFVLVLVVAACGTDDVVEPGVIVWDQYDVTVDVPDATTVGSPIAISVRTYGGHCRVMDETRVTINADEALVEPFDRYVDPRDDGGCIQIVQFFQHKGTITFTTRGTKTVRVSGRRVSTYPPVEDVPYEVVLPLTVE